MEDRMRRYKYISTQNSRRKERTKKRQYWRNDYQEFSKNNGRQNPDTWHIAYIKKGKYKNQKKLHLNVLTVGQMKDKDKDRQGTTNRMSGTLLNSSTERQKIVEK